MCYTGIKSKACQAAGFVEDSHLPATRLATTSVKLRSHATRQAYAPTKKATNGRLLFSLKSDYSIFALVRMSTSAFCMVCCCRRCIMFAFTSR